MSWKGGGGKQQAAKGGGWGSGGDAWSAAPAGGGWGAAAAPTRAAVSAPAARTAGKGAAKPAGAVAAPAGRVGGKAAPSAAKAAGPTGGKPAAKATGPGASLWVSSKLPHDELLVMSVMGSYEEKGENHGRKYYKKIERIPGHEDLDVLLYYWDNSQGDDFSGWWFGDQLGGTQVFARSASHSLAPPRVGWKLPWDSDKVTPGCIVIDTKAPVGAVGAAKAAGKGEAQAAGKAGGAATAAAQAKIVAQRQALQAEKMAEQKLKLEEQKAAQALKLEEQKEMQALAQAAKEAGDAKRKEDLQAKREQAETRRASAIAVMHVRKVIQKVKIATLANFDSLCEELDAAILERIEELGASADSVREEAEKTLDEARKRQETLKEEEEEKEKKKIEMEQKRIEAKEKAEEKRIEDEEKLKVLVEEANEVIVATEAAVTKVVEAAKPLDAEGEQSPEDIVTAADVLEEAAKEAEALVKKANEALPLKRKEMHAISKAEKGVDFKSLHERLRDSTGKLPTLRSKAKAAKVRAARIIANTKREKAQKDIFGKFAKGKDGKMKKEEITAFAKNEYGFDAAADFLERCVRILAGGQGGVPFSKFRRLKNWAAVESSTLKAREARAAAEEQARLRKEEMLKKKAEMDAKKAEAQKALADTKEVFDAVVEAMAKVKEAQAPLAPKAGTKADDLVDAADTAALTAKKAEEAIATADAALQAIGVSSDLEGSTAATFGLFIKKLVAEDGKKILAAREELKKVDKVVSDAKARLLGLQHNELEPIRIKIAGCLTDILVAKEQTAAQFFEAAVGAGKGMDSAAFMKFAKSLSEKAASADALPETLQKDTFNEKQVESLFKHCLFTGESEITQERFAELLTKVYHRVVKATILTEDASITSKSRQKLEERQLLRMLETPKADEATNVTRMKCCLSTDEAMVGWVTVAGNKGTLFLEQCHRFQVCLKEIPLGETSAPEAKAVRKLAAKEIVEVLEWDCKDVTTMKRIRVRANSDAATGWVSWATSKGVPFVEPWKPK